MSSMYTNLVIEGGGVLGVAYCGALAELESKGIMRNIINYAGASAGSIVAGILACGGRSDYISSVMKTLNFRDFLDYGNVIRAAYNVLRYKGACPGDYFCEWYGNAISQLINGGAGITLKELNQLRGGLLVFSVVNITQRRIEFWDYKNKPDMPLVLAVRASMSIQGIFMPVEIDGDLFVDGGTLCNYPIKAFHYNGPDGDIINPHTLGLMLMSDSEFNLEYPKINSLIEYGLANVEAIWIQPQKIYMDEQDWKRTIKIPTGDISSINFNIRADEIDKLIKNGRIAVQKYFCGERTFAKTSVKILRSEYTAKDEVIKRRRTVPEFKKLPPQIHSSDPNWSEIRDGLMEVEDLNYERDDCADECDDRDLLIVSEKIKKIKQSVGVSPPIRINQFNLE